jgi:membrane protein
MPANTPNELLRQLRERLWEDRETFSRMERRLLVVGRYATVLVRDLMEGSLSMRAMSLVYTSLLSVVPLLALGFSVLKALGVHNSLEPVLLGLLEPLGPQAEEITRNVIGFVENIKVGVLGSVGVGFLLYTVISLIQKVETSFNYIWRIEQPRGLSQRFGEYLSVLMVGPVLVFSAIGLTATVLNSGLVAEVRAIEPFGTLVVGVTKLLPYVLIVGAFTFLYSFIPNTRVRAGAALAGGLLAGVLWQSGSILFARFVAGATNYNAIYSGFAIMIFLLIWLHLGWLILLIGCQLSFYVQHPEHLRQTRVAPYLSAHAAEFLGLAIVAMVGRRFLAAGPMLHREELARALNAPPDHIEHVVEVLIHQGVLAVAGQDRLGLLPGRDLDALKLAELWRLIRRGFDPGARSRSELAQTVADLLDQAESGFVKGPGGRSVREWLNTSKSS